MKARPILFSGPMVRAILDSRKTQTRRIVASNEQLDAFDLFGVGETSVAGKSRGFCATFRAPESRWIGLDKPWHTFVPCPYGKPGDVLWVREGFSGPHCMDAQDDLPAAPPSEWPADCEIHFWADGNPAYGDWTRPKPSIHMPRWASRITLEVESIRVERLQDISEEDAVAEGIGTPRDIRYAVQDGFKPLWQSINGPESWAANPWVWVISYRAHLMNVDEFLKQREAA